MNKKVLINIASLLGVQGIGYLIPLITLPYLVRVLHPHGYGIYSYALAISQYFVLLVDFGFNLSITKKISQNKDDLFEVSSVFWNTLSCKSILLLLGFLITLIWSVLDPLFENNRYVLISAFTIVLGNMLFPIWLFQGKEEMANIAFSNVCAKLIAVPAIFLLVTEQSDVWLACLINGVTFVIAGIIGLYIVHKRNWIIWVVPSFKKMKVEYKEALHIFISTAAINIYTSSITVILGLMTSPTAVGYFSAADKIRLAVQGLIGPVSQALYPRINALMIKDKRMAFNTIHFLLKVQGGIALSISIVLFLLSEKIILFMYGVNYIDAISVMKVLAWLPFIVAVSNVFGYQTLLTLNLAKILSRAVLLGAICSMLMIFPLIKTWNIAGAAFTILLAELIVNQSMLIYIAHNKIPIFKKVKNDEG
ncbi:flippase [Citrobacter sedlakii]|uniref:flippase n=1 Tax=Citrobacter sedlakii TaxID=67826 RepID=UPI003336B220